MLFPVAALTNPHMPGASHAEIALIEARGQKVSLGLMGLAPSEGTKEGSCRPLQLLVAVVSPVDTSLHLHMPSPCVCLHVAFLLGHTSPWI